MMLYIFANVLQPTTSFVLSLIMYTPAYHNFHYTLRSNMSSTLNRLADVMAAYHSVFVVQRKNCEPLVFGPAFAIDKIPENKTISD